MTDIVKQEVGGQVFIPESLNDTDKEYLQEVSGQITTTIQRAAVRVGFYLLEVKERFRGEKTFSGPNGWFTRWYTSVGLNLGAAQGCMNAATLSIKFPQYADAVELLSTETLRNLAQPNAKGGTPSTLQKRVLQLTSEGEPPSRHQIREWKSDPDSKLEALTEFKDLAQRRLSVAKEALDNYDGLRDYAKNPEFQKVDTEYRQALSSLKDTQANIEKLLNAPDPVAEQFEKSHQVFTRLQQRIAHRDMLSKMSRAEKRRVLDAEMRHDLLLTGAWNSGKIIEYSIEYMARAFANAVNPDLRGELVHGDSRVGMKEVFQSLPLVSAA